MIRAYDALAGLWARVRYVFESDRGDRPIPGPRGWQGLLLYFLGGVALGHGYQIDNFLVSVGVMVLIVNVFLAVWRHMTRKTMRYAIIRKHYGDPGVEVYVQDWQADELENSFQPAKVYVLAADMISAQFWAEEREIPRDRWTYLGHQHQLHGLKDVCVAYGPGWSLHPRHQDLSAQINVLSAVGQVQVIR